MRRNLLLFLAICSLYLPVCGQDITFPDTLPAFTHAWQEQLLQQVDADALGTEAYSQLLDELSELVVWSDTTARRPRFSQQVVLSANRCLSTRAGYLDATEEARQDSKAYLGDPWHHTLRYRASLGQRWQGGLTLEKDPGEAWRHQWPVYDSWHAFVRLRHARLSSSVRLEDAVVGHYRLRTGCGLVMSQGFSLGKQYVTQQIRSARTNTLSPHASVTESGYMQGAAADVRVGRHLTFLPYISARRIDGALSADNVLTSLPTDGYHRTTKEAAKRQAAWQTVAGLRVGWRGEWYDVGLHGTYTQLQYNYRRSANYCNTHYFAGNRLAHFAADYTLRALGGVLRGECALDDRGALASLHMLHYPLGDTWRATLLHRYYSDRYRQLHGASVAESSAMQGEQGVLLCLEGQPARRWQAEALLDWFRFSQPQYGIRDTTSQGLEASMRLRYTGSSHSRCPADVSMAYRLKVKGDYIRHTADVVTSLQPLQHLTCRTQLRARIYSKVDNNPSYGWAVSQSAAWQGELPKGLPFQLEAQASYFHTDDYDARLYLTERNLLYGFGLPMLYGEGLRYSLTSTFTFGRRYHLDLKWALTNYADRTSISSGLQQIRGNVQHDLWLNLRGKF